MVGLREIVNFLDQYLQIDSIEDESWNGLQVEGNSRVQKALFAVDASIDTFKEAAHDHIDLIVVHHGHYWKYANPSLTGWSKERIDLLINNGISLYACHLPLDRQREVGNNVQLLQLLGAEVKEEFIQHRGKNIGWIGETRQPVLLSKIEELLNAQLNTRCSTLPFGKEECRTIAVCSGGGGYAGFFEALNKHADLYITGDTVEIYATAKDAKMNVIFAGHHATEIVGVRALARIVEQQFAIETIFVDIPTGL
jgi:dinuclear metal center YbgI/SA1388 family protein